MREPVRYQSEGQISPWGDQRTSEYSILLNKTRARVSREAGLFAFPAVAKIICSQI